MVKPDLNAVEKGLYHGSIASLGYALIGVVEVIVVVSEPYGDPFYDGSGKLRCASSPLLFGVALDKGVVYVCTDQRQGLLLNVLWGRVLYALGSKLFSCLVRGNGAPKGVKGVHVKRQVIKLTLIVCHWAVDKWHEGCVFVYVIPYFLVGCVENVGAVLVYLNAVYVFRVAVAANVAFGVDNKAFFARIGHFSCKNAAEKPCAYYQIIVHIITPVLRVCIKIYSLPW